MRQLQAELGNAEKRHPPQHQLQLQRTKKPRAPRIQASEDGRRKPIRIPIPFIAR